MTSPSLPPQNSSRSSMTAPRAWPGCSSTGSRVRPREAYRYPDEDEDWHSLTWAETGDHVTRLAAGLVALGVQPEERVAIASGTRYEWILADLAITPPARPRPRSTRRRSPRTSPTSSPTPAAASCSPRTTSRSTSSREKRAELPDDHEGRHVRRHGRRRLGHRLRRPRAARRRPASSSTRRSSRSASRPSSPDDLATLIYTSGTTGRPKGVRLQPRRLDLRGRRVSRPAASSARTTCSSSGCRWRTRSARCC